MNRNTPIEPSGPRLDELVSPELESGYRQQVFTDDWNLIRGMIIVGIMAMCPFLCIDVVLNEAFAEIQSLFYVRLVVLGIFALFFVSTSHFPSGSSTPPSH